MDAIINADRLEVVKYYHKKNGKLSTSDYVEMINMLDCTDTVLFEDEYLESNLIRYFNQTLEQRLLYLKSKLVMDSGWELRTFTHDFEDAVSSWLGGDDFDDAFFLFLRDFDEPSIDLTLLDDWKNPEELIFLINYISVQKAEELIQEHWNSIFN